MNDWQKIWRNADAVCFDVDSTLITSEAIDELAEFRGVGKEVAELTTKAMGDGLSFRESLYQRLSLIKPSKDVLDAFINKNPFELSPGVVDLIEILKIRNVDIYLISGGFRPIINAIANSLNIPTENVFANEILFSKNGEYEGFDEEEPTSSSGGKKVVIEKLIEKYNYNNIVMIGDGMTDLEAFPPARLFIGYGGNKLRENVRMLAPHYVMHFNELIVAFN
ncbi:phosphoserine phosphatase isoform X1 [Hydra vulgaris]|uniref:phosphoserine phosphatase isoform X1 n=1 Tax=Hydra vulgaris TaxID=6087 RepID=UPI001F5EBBE6|nr:phosphoserine phosphatase [Hydra vulgaris]